MAKNLIQIVARTDGEFDFISDGKKLGEASRLDFAIDILFDFITPSLVGDFDIDILYGARRFRLINGGDNG